MNGRQYDRNADLISQVLWKISKLDTRGDITASTQKMSMMLALQTALECNDVLGKMAEKGLI
jgi:hypothetical protein